MDSQSTKVTRNFPKRHAGLVTTFVMLLLSALMSYPLMAQIGGAGGIQGTVTDSTGAVIPKAAVIATNDSTQVRTTRTTGESGQYLISPLPPGNYTVTVQATGFQTLAQQNIVVNAISVTGLNLTVHFGAQTEQVTVSTAPPALETTSGTLSETMEEKTYAALPLSMNGAQRNPTSFLYLMPGVQAGGTSGIFNGQGSDKGRVDEVYIEGIPETTLGQGDVRSMTVGVSVDAVSQFQVISNGAPVEFQGMGVQSYEIKQGTNQYHGSVYDYVRNTLFDTWGFFAPAATQKNAAGQTVQAPKPPEHQNEYGITVGGPIKRQKVFFFASYGGYRNTAGVKPGLLTVPTTQELTGDFTAFPYPIYDPTTLAACTAANGGKACTYQFMGAKNGTATPNVIPAGEISPMAQYMQKFLPAPSNSALNNNYLAGQSSGNLSWFLTGRVDINLSDNNRASIINNTGVHAYPGLDFNQSAGTIVLPPPYVNAVYVTTKTTSNIVEDTYVFSPHLVNQIKYAYLRDWVTVGNPTLSVAQYEAGPGGVGIGNLPQGQASLTFPGVSFSGAADSPTAWSSQNGYGQYENTYVAMDNVQWTRNKHSFTFGGDYQWENTNQSSFATQSAPLSLAFANTETSGYNSAGTIQSTNTGNSYASFLMGAVNSTSVSVQPFSTLGSRFYNFSPWIADDYRPNARLTVNLGLRWDLFQPFKEAQNRWSFLNAVLINPATGTPGALQFAGNGTDSCQCRTPVHEYLKNLGPRVGFAYLLNNKTVVRGTFNITYSHGGGVGGASGATNGSGQLGLSANPSFLSSGQGGIPAFYLNSNIGALSNTAFPAYSTAPNISPIVNSGNYINSAGVAITPSSITYADPIVGGRAPYSENWSLGFQRALTRDITASVSYSGSESHFLWSAETARGYYVNQLDPKYEVLGSLLTKLPNSIDPATGKTYLSEAQAIVPGVQLPYSNFGSANGTIQAMLNPFPQYSGVTDLWGNVSNADFNSVQVTLAQRPAHGLSYTVNYTYSKEIDDTGTFRTGYAIPAGVTTDGKAWKQDRIDRSLGAGEEPQVLSAFGVYELPFGKGSGQWLVKKLESDWILSGIFSYASGSPLNIVGSGCQAVGLGTCMPSYASGFSGTARQNGGWGHGVTAATVGSVKFINPSAFTVPTTYQIGNIARSGADNLFGPGVSTLNLSVRRTFKLWREGSQFVLQADVFNVDNNVLFGGIGTTLPSTNAASSSFGTVSSQANSSRDFQFAGRFNF